MINHMIVHSYSRLTLCISFTLSQQVVFETQHTLVITQFTLAVNLNNILVKRAIWQDFDAELAMPKTLFFINFCSRRLVSAAIHNITAASQVQSRPRVIHACVKVFINVYIYDHVFYFQKQVPSHWSFLGECCNDVLL